MLKKFLIFAVGTFTAVKLFSKDKKDCFASPHWFYFYIDTKNKNITIKCKKVNNTDAVFIMTRTKDNLLIPLNITRYKDLFLISRLAFAEADAEPYWVKQGVAEVILNRVKNNEAASERYCRHIFFKKFKTVEQVVYNGFLGVNNKQFKNPFKYIAEAGEPHTERKMFIDSITAAINAYYFKSNLLQNALFFVADCYYKNFYKNCKTLPRIIPLNKEKAHTCFYHKIEDQL